VILLGHLLTWCLIIFGALRASIGIYVLINFVDPVAYEAATRRYIGSGSAGDAIDKGLIYLAFGIVVGLIVRIAKNTTRTET